MTSKPVQVADNVLGYTLIERIGSGGFGEVWSAEAPGGLRKAVKLVYGFHDEKRAQAELKALDRIKEVRHPFLLSLERIEIFQGQLVVVTELADKSVADLFDEYTLTGEPGIPREELIRYVREAADALDYLSETHKLQHLDIKPENLLLVSGHVKVADFGLVKDLKHDVSQSLMSGMTPAYAAPELFDGQPGNKSDQYSLAILYQEMLTSVRPFPGTTPAQLAAQHMHGKPNLSTLPPGDQPIIARSLAKDPNVRYASCREMAEDLSNQKRKVKKAIKRITRPRDEARTEFNTVSTEGLRDVTAVMSQSEMPFQAIELKTLEPPNCDTNEAKLRPTLILTVGKTANRVAQKLKERLVTQHGSMQAIPSIRIIAFDTDRKEIGKLCMHGGHSALASDEVIEMPLAKPENYREKASSHLTWLSRRWIYNIPRSLQTEGLRPLGRLAFADHFEKVLAGLQTAIKEITKEENLAQTVETVGIDPDTQPNVIILSAISGGVGSGMTLDLAYTVKLLLAERGLKTDCVKAMLLHSTNQRTSDPGLAAANAFAFLTELRHFVEQGYPGDDSIGLPDFEDEPPMDHIYFQDLGSDLRDSQFESTLDSLAEYVYLNTMSRCGIFFDECLKLGEEIDHFALRTFGLSSCRPGRQSGSTNMLARALIKRWIEGDPEVENVAHDFVGRLFEEHQVSYDLITERIATATGEALQESGLARTQQFARELLSSAQPDRLAQLQDYFDAIFGCPPNRKDSSHVDPEICVHLDHWVSQNGQSSGDAVAGQILEMLSEQQLDLSGPMGAINEAERQIELTSDRLQQEMDSCLIEIDNLSQSLFEMTQNPMNDPEVVQLFEETLSNYCNCRYRDLLLRYSREYCRVLRNSVVSTRGILNRMKSQLIALYDSFANPDDFDPDEVSELGFSMERLMGHSVFDKMYEYTQRVETQVYKSLIEESGGYLNYLGTSNWQDRLPIEIRDASQLVLADAFKRISLDQIISDNELPPQQLVAWLNAKLNSARPSLDHCGGSARVMVGLPQHGQSTTLSELIASQFHVETEAVCGTDGSFVLCFETEDISIANVAFQLLEQRPDAVELVKRIHTRNDIEWSSLDELL